MATAGRMRNCLEAYVDSGEDDLDYMKRTGRNEANIKYST
jgi:hypothetical protein